MRSATRSASRQNRGSRQRCTRPFRSRPHLHRGAGGTNRQRVFRRFASRLGPRGRRAWKLRQTYSRRPQQDRKSTRLNSSHLGISYAVFCLKKKNQQGEEGEEPMRV